MGLQGDISMVYFMPESHVDSFDTLDEAIQLCRFMNDRFTDDPRCNPSLKFRAVIETDGTISVHSSSPVNQFGKSVFKETVAEFQLTHVAPVAVSNQGRPGVKGGRSAMQFYDVDTFVATCRTTNGALELARFLERKFPLDSRITGDQIHKFNVTVELDGKVEVHSAVAVNELGREDFKKYVADFLQIKMQRKPVQSAKPAAMAATAA
jgi:hypothetical protein